ncbi:MAG: HpcH/HpaI aldolase family protein [Amycolatopsis sp.]|uniref:hypothetical protein n=1 Tax=Amycolatopsis sp. TaxID=37632 RepID=UPI002622643B|nr:hypothetical protein [Amycolatopsis sp.]MCU1682303.1 HpcH/HpaI aldolase family protein [Amycolatopsis sp.]
MFDTDNRLLAMLEKQQIPLGMQCFTAHRGPDEVFGLTGFDFVMLDTEHSPANPRAIEDGGGRPGPVRAHGQIGRGHSASPVVPLIT